MLIRFLSYLASIIGARRYKPLLISCLALVFSVASILTLISTVSNDSSDAASTVQQEDDLPSKSQQSSSPGLSGFEQKTAKDESAAAGGQQQGADPAPPETKPQANTPAKNSAFDITLNTATVSLSQDSPDAAVTVTASENGKIQWSISPDNAGNGLTARIEQVKDTASNAVIRFRTDSFTPGTYQFIVTAKTFSGALNASKTISVTVN